MCGIAGIINLKGISRQSLRDMSVALKHRGPDGFGYMVYSEYKGQSIWLNEELPSDTASEDIVGFAHRRLSIIDLSIASLQPMVDDTGAYCLVYNGELYNYIELRTELERLNYSFRTTGDTEAVLYAYKEWGSDCFKKFNGMWAMAILDRRKKCVVFSRDRFGIKPLYYTFIDNACYFASEI